MGILFNILLVEAAVFLALAIILMVLLLWWLTRKIVLVPTLSVDVDKAEYARDEVVQISGILTDGINPLAGKSVALAIQPPTGDAYSLTPAVTDENGAFASKWAVPEDAVGGVYAVVASALGVSATKTFNLV